ncbi:MAG: uroporphyrinogen decarboxylase family protein [Armatimonadota bacterium]
MTAMTPRERMIAALEHRPMTGRVPHFELVFYLTMEAFGKFHPCSRYYENWQQMQPKERELHLQDMAEIYLATAERFEHDAIFVHGNAAGEEALARLVEILRERSDDRYFLMVGCDATYGIPSGKDMEAFSLRLADEPEQVKAEADAMVNRALEHVVRWQARGSVDGFAMCADYCLNSGPFLSPAQFSEFVTPYLARLIAGMREMDFYAIKHTDGNIMPILDQLVQARPHALHSLDPQAGVDIAEVKRRYGKEICLVGNVNCGLLDTGTDEECVASARYALQHGMPGGGYIFSTSNCVYTGMRLSRYELILDVWRREGNYPG